MAPFRHGRPRGVRRREDGNRTLRRLSLLALPLLAIVLSIAVPRVWAGRGGSGEEVVGLMERAVKLHAEGAVEACRGLYESVLAIRPEHVTALHNLAAIQHTTGQHAKVCGDIRQMQVGYGVEMVDRYVHI